MQSEICGSELSALKLLVWKSFSHIFPTTKSQNEHFGSYPSGTMWEEFGNILRLINHSDDAFNAELLGEAAFCMQFSSPFSSDF